MPSKVTTIRLTPHELWQLRRIAEDAGLPLATLIRDAVSVYVEHVTVTCDCRSICITPPSEQP